MVFNGPHFCGAASPLVRSIESVLHVFEQDTGVHVSRCGRRGLFFRRCLEEVSDLRDVFYHLLPASAEGSRSVDVLVDLANSDLRRPEADEKQRAVCQIIFLPNHHGLLRKNLTFLRFCADPVQHPQTLSGGGAVGTYRAGTWPPTGLVNVSQPR